MRIDCFISPTCSSGESLKENIDRALEAEGMDAEVIFSLVNELEAARLGLKGSPSILINGIDIQPIETPGFAWRMFKDESGRLANVPSVEMLRNAIRKMGEQEGAES